MHGRTSKQAMNAGSSIFAAAAGRVALATFLVRRIAPRPRRRARPICARRPSRRSGAFAGPLSRTHPEGLPIKIVAIGSSSTYGAGASSAPASYPSRLEAELKARLPGLPITVLNKGIGGEEAAQMVARFDADVLDESPDLVVWQVGSNSVLLNHPAPGTIIHQGVERLKASGTEVVLMNPQYAPKIIAKPDAEHAVDVIGDRAFEVGLVDRFRRRCATGAKARRYRSGAVPLARWAAHV